MAQRTGQMLVVNASSQSITGTAWHRSGDGSNAISSPQPPLQVNLPSFAANNLPYSNQIQIRSDHDDYWLWQPQNSTKQYQVKQNLKASSVGACLVITDSVVVVVTSDNGVGSTNL